MPISCLLPCADPGIFVRRGGGGGVHVNLTKKALTTLLHLFFFSFFLVLCLFYRSQMVNFKEIYHFSRFRRRYKFFSGGGGCPTFSRGGGVHFLFPIETNITCDLPAGVRTPCPPSGSALGCDLIIYLVSHSAK